MQKWPGLALPCPALPLEFPESEYSTYLLLTFFPPRSHSDPSEPGVTPQRVAHRGTRAALRCPWARIVGDQRMDLGARMFGFECWFCHFLVV